ncbi:MAG TPA: 1-acyl-sn-glycerol-3-phosphate acyltransferase [Holophagaceae bacterium]
MARGDGLARPLARILAGLWFRSLRLEGPPVPPGPALILMNHPNGLLDPLAAEALLDPAPGWLAKATLWRVPPLRPFLAMFRAIPVTRPKDGGATPEAIAESFRRVHQVLEGGGSVALFPEGVSHTGADLAPLKTGAARIALSSPVPPRLVPAGLVYGERALFRHGALVRTGPEIPWMDLRSRGTDPEAVLELTARIRVALLPLTLHGPEAGSLALAQEVAWMLAEAPGSRADLEALRRRVKVLLPRLQAMAAVDRVALQAEVQAARDWLSDKGVRPDQVGHPYPWSEVRHWLPRAALRLVLGGLVLPAALCFWPPYRLVGWVVARATDELDVTATLKLMAGLLVFPLWTLLLALGAGRWLGWLGVGWALLAALLAVLSLPLGERLAEDLQAVRGFLRRRDAAVPHLLEARRRLLEAFPELGT